MDGWLDGVAAPLNYHDLLSALRIICELKITSFFCTENVNATSICLCNNHLLFLFYFYSENTFIMVKNTSFF